MKWAKNRITVMFKIKNDGCRIFFTAFLVAAVGFGCGGGPESYETGIIAIDGSSTVFPITEAVAEEFQQTSPDTRVTVGISGTGGGFSKFCALRSIHCLILGAPWKPSYGGSGEKKSLKSAHWMWRTG